MDSEIISYKKFRLVHELKRRIRIMSPVLKNDQERCYILEILLKKRQEILRVRSVSAIGCVVIDFDATHLPKKNLLILLDAVLANIAHKKPQPHKPLPKQYSGEMREIELAVQGMSCASCALLIEMVLNKDTRVKSASVNFATETVVVQGQLDREQITQKLADLGYEGLPMDTLSQRKSLILKEEKKIALAKQRFIYATVLSIPVLVVAMSMRQANWMRWFQFILTTPVVFDAGHSFFTKAWRLAKQKAANMDTLISLGVGSAYGYSLPALLRGKGHIYFEAAAAIISFVLLGRYLEERARGKAGEAIRQLIDLQPQTATLLRNGNELVIDVDALALDDVLLVRPGEKVPTDGVVILGLSTVDEAMVTGESMPVVKEVGHAVMGGCVNGNGVLHIRVTAIGMDTVLAGIVHLVDQAQAAKLPIQKQVDKISAVFVPAVMGIAALTFASWMWVGAPITTAFANAVTVLLIACPCALGLATPAAIMVGTGQAAKKGVFIRNGESLEVATQLNVMVFDKTGTITEGKPEVTDFYNISSIDDETIIALAASAEHNSEHFLARAVVEYAHQHELELMACSYFYSATGRGIEAEIQGSRLLLGNQQWMNENAVNVTALLEQAGCFAEQGKTPVYVAVAGVESAIFGIADKPRAEASRAISRLDKMGIQTFMVTGDTEKTAIYVATQVGIEHVVANATPEQKLEIIRKLQAEGKRVGMIGDGINDAPALAAADVGFAIGSGTDIAIESSDLTLMQGDISKVTDTIELSSDTIKIIKQNLFWAFGYNTVAIPVAALGRLNPMVASVAMALSSVSVIVNSLRLNRK